ncbi:MAG: diguanylate cyclase [Magnetococcus sp. YQC-3]
MSSTIAQKFTLLFWVLISSALGVTGWFAFHITEEAVISSASQGMQRGLEEILHQTEVFHSSASGTLRLALEHPAFGEYFSLLETRAGNRQDAQGHVVFTDAQQALRQQLIQWTLSIQKQFPISEICLIDALGQEHVRLVHGKAAPEGELSSSEADAPFFAPALRLASGDVHIQYPYMSGDVLQWVFAYVSPVVLKDGSKPALYHFEIPVAFFQNVVFAHTGSNARMLVVDPNGLVVADNTRVTSLAVKPGSDPEGKHDLADYLPRWETVYDSADFLAILQKTREESSGWGSFQVGEQRYFTAFLRMPLFGWSLVQVKSYEDLLGGNTSLGTIRTILLLSSGTVLLLATLLVLFFSRRITHPLLRITTAMQQLERGDFSQPLAVSGQDELGYMVRVFNTMRHELQKSRDTLIQEKNKLTTIILSAREAIVAANERDEVVLLNPAAEHVLDKTSAEIVQGGLLGLVDDPEYVRAFLDCQGQEMPEVLVYKQRILGFHAAKITDDTGKHIGSAALIRDITEEKRLENRLREMSFTDKLTGLFNRRWLEEALLREISHALRHGLDLSILFFDVDHFKRFNDTYGHDMGDRVLESIGQLARRNFRKADSPCRYGGEEFCVILANTAVEGAMICAEKFRRVVESAPMEGSQVTISLGVAVLTRTAPPMTPAELLKLADNALYESKRAGRNRVTLGNDFPAP